MGEGGARSGPGFLVILKPFLGPKISPKICLKFVNFWVQFWILFCWGFGALWVPLGSLLGPFDALLGGLKSEKMPTVQRENHFFINTGFWFFEDPNGPLGLILVPLGQIWSQNGSQHGSKSDQKVDQKFLKKTKKNGRPPGFH